MIDFGHQAHLAHRILIDGAFGFRQGVVDVDVGVLRVESAGAGQYRQAAAEQPGLELLSEWCGVHSGFLNGWVIVRRRQWCLCWC